MRIDHIAYRVAQGKRDEAERFFVEALGYRRQTDPFPIYFNDEKTDMAMCVALEPPEKPVGYFVPWQSAVMHEEGAADYYMAPEIFLSEGTPGSIVADWVAKRAGIGGIHHIAFQVDDVEATMREWREKGWATFTTDKPMTCPGLTQVFSAPNCTGVIYEFIRRDGEHGFCASNVKELMLSTVGFDGNRL